MKKKLKEIELGNDEMKIETSILKLHDKKIALENLAKALSEKSMMDKIKTGKSRISVKNK